MLYTDLITAASAMFSGDAVIIAVVGAMAIVGVFTRYSGAIKRFFR